MISFELAKKLKEAGFKWKPAFVAGAGVGDWYYTSEGELDIVAPRDYDLTYVADELVFAPRLDQLLAEIEKRGYLWQLIKMYDRVRCDVFWGDVSWLAWDDCAENAAANALLWIYRRKLVDEGGTG